MNELNLKDISKETTKGPTKVMVGSNSLLPRLSAKPCKVTIPLYKSSVYNCNWYLIRNVCPYHMKEKNAHILVIAARGLISFYARVL